MGVVINTGIPNTVCVDLVTGYAYYFKNTCTSFMWAWTIVPIPVLDFLIIVSATGFGLPKFGQCQPKGYIKPSQVEGQVA